MIDTPAFAKPEFGWDGYTLTAYGPDRRAIMFQIEHDQLERLLLFIEYLKSSECSGWSK